MFGEVARKEIGVQPYVYSFLKKELGAAEKIYTIDGKTFKTRDIIILFFKYLHNIIEEYLPAGQIDVILTSPAYFTNDKKKMLIWCAQKAGFNVLKTIDEPSASAIYYDIDRKIPNGRILVYDLGGGTLDVSILDIANGEFAAMPTRGDSDLGGGD
ncbi:hypothetical protein FACS1894166_10190 [Bacilli bacterium]|nr:hypothetical protein FACS1894166_10190 [Bacilli bacterium]